MKNKFLLILGLFFFTTSTLFSQKEYLQSGPMVGYSTMKEVLLWVQTTQPAQVYFEYWNVKTPQNRIQTERALTAKKGKFSS